MSTMNVSLPDALKNFVDAQVAEAHYGSTSEYVRHLLRRDQDRVALRNLLLAGAASGPANTADPAWFDQLRERARQQPDA